MTRVGFAGRLACLGAAFLVMWPALSLARRTSWRRGDRGPVLFHRVFLWLFRVRVRVVGEPPRRTVPTLILANHVSWLDIPVMGSLAPLAFVAKSEIEGWPVIGYLAKLQRCIFLDRVRKSATAEVNAVMAHRLAGGEAIVLFPEGTTGDGIRLLPFRSSLVGAARAALVGHRGPGEELERIWLQPLAILYGGRRGLPVTRREMPQIAWYGDMELVPHVDGFRRGGPLDVVVVWGEPIPFDAASDRKSAAAAAERAVGDALRRERSRPPLFLAARKP